MNSIFRTKKHKPKTEIISVSDTATATAETAKKTTLAAAAAATMMPNRTEIHMDSAKLILDTVRWEASALNFGHPRRP